MAIRLGQVNLVADDVPGSVEFYRLLGLTVDEAGDAWDSHHRTVEASDGIDVDIDSRAFASAYWASEDLPNGVALTFRVDSRADVDAYYERVTAAGYRGIKTPFDAFWGARYAIVLDPSGVAVAFMSPRDQDSRSTPPDPSTF